MSKYVKETRSIPSTGRDIKVLIFRPDLSAGRPVSMETFDGEKGCWREDVPDRPLRPGILWIHGGGYLWGMASMAYASRALPLVEKYGAVVITPDYRLSEEAPYPAALEDCYMALRYLKEHAAELGVDESQIFVGGESSGGGLAAAVCIAARDRGDVAVAYQMPLYPMIDDRDTPSSRDNREFIWNTFLNHKGWRAYLAGLAVDGKPVAGDPDADVPPTAAPARETDYRGLPPCYTFVGTHEPFYAETIAYVRNLRAAGVEAICDVYATGEHAFDMLSPWRAISQRAAERFEEHYLYAATHYCAEQPR